MSCSSLTSISVDPGNPVFTADNGVLINKSDMTLVAYPAGKTVTEYSVPQGITAIAAGAFFNAHRLTAVNLPDSLESIGDNAFDSCWSLTSIRLPENLQYIGEGAFASCVSLPSIGIDPDNPVFAAENGVLFNKQDMTLAVYPEGKADTEYSVPLGCMAIGDGAFLSNRQLMSISLPDGLQSIGSLAFAHCIALESVTLPATLVSIDYLAFYCCNSLTTVTLPDSLQTIASDAFRGCENLTLIVTRDSFAHQYAADHGIPFMFADDSAIGN